MPLCESAQKDCPTDGRYVYWSPDSSKAKRCWKIGTRGPCANDEILQFFEDNDGELELKCVNSVSSYSFGVRAPLRHNAPCPKGFYRNQKLQCRSSFY